MFGHDDGKYWPVVADFFLTILGVFVVLYVSAERPNPDLPPKLDALGTTLTAEKEQGLVQYFDVNDRWIRIVYSAKSLGFEPCDWRLPEESAARLRADLRALSALAPFIELLQIEGHADRDSALNCR